MRIAVCRDTTEAKRCAMSSTHFDKIIVITTRAATGFGGAYYDIGRGLDVLDMSENDFEIYVQQEA